MDGKKSVIRNLFSTSSKNIIEPLTCLIRLSMLNYENDNTKIGISNNRIFFYRRNFLQGLTRTLFRESRENLHNLHNPITKSISWYNCNCFEIRYIFQYAIKGLQKLKMSYETESIINHSLDRYIDILNAEFQNYESDNLETGNNNTDFLKILLEEEDNESKISLYQNLVSIWDYRNVQTIYNLLQDLEKSTDTQNTQVYLEALDTVLSMKESEVTKIIVNNSTIL